MLNEDKIREIARHYGAYNQSIQAVEEMAELTQALTKFWRYSGEKQSIISEHKENVFEELADVKIMIAQLEVLFFAREDVDKIAEKKIERQLRRIAEGKE